VSTEAREHLSLEYPLSESPMRHIRLVFLDLANGIFEVLDGKLWAAMSKNFNGHKLAMTYVLNRLAGEDVAHQSLHPLLISLRSSCVPSVQAVELEWHHMSQVMDGG
jgi:hypothetical protein